MDYVLPRGHSIEVRFAGGKSKKLCSWDKSFTAADVKKLIASGRCCQNDNNNTFEGVAFERQRLFQDGKELKNMPDPKCANEDCILDLKMRTAAEAKAKLLLKPKQQGSFACALFSSNCSFSACTTVLSPRYSAPMMLEQRGFRSPCAQCMRGKHHACAQRRLCR